MKIYPGTSIIEILIATAMISLAVVGALSLSSRSQAQNAYAKNLAQATQYANQAADWIRGERNSLGYATLAAQNDDGYCLNNLPVDFTLIQSGNCGAGTYIASTPFTRNLTLTKDGNTLYFLIVVSWEDKTTRQASIELELKPW